MTAHVFVDESKRGGYLVTAAAVLQAHLGQARAEKVVPRLVGR